ncbi:MAG: hypothetical protein ACREPP_10820 [Rhodanobacteraceae bacterium]
MKTLTACVVTTLSLAAATSTWAADANQMVVSRNYNDTVAPVDQQAYEAGVKAFNECLHKHGSKYTWTALSHETGNVYKYSYVIGPYTWADFDAMGATDKDCDATWRSQGNPHLKDETSSFLVDQPDMSHMPTGWNKQPQPPLMSVTYFTLNPGHEANVAFTTAVKQIAAAAMKAKWPYYYRTLKVEGGDEGSPDYILVFPQKSWADYGMEADPSVWKMLEGVYGKSDADALRKSINDAIKTSSEHIDSYNADLSYTAGK